MRVILASVRPKAGERWPVRLDQQLIEKIRRMDKNKLSICFNDLQRKLNSLRRSDAHGFDDLYEVVIDDHDNTSERWTVQLVMKHRSYDTSESALFVSREIERFLYEF